MSLPNITEKKRSVLSLLIFAIRASISADKKLFFLRTCSAILGTVLSFVQVGALSIVVNEFAANGIANARPTVLVAGVGAIILFQFIPSVFQYFDMHYNEVGWNTLTLEFQKMMQNSLNRIDMATIEQSEFKNKLYLANSRGINSLVAIQNWVIEILRYTAVLIVATIALIVISPWSLLVIAVGVIPLFFIEHRTGKIRFNIWEQQTERRRIIGAKNSAISGSYGILENKLNNSLLYFIKKIYDFTKGSNDELHTLGQKSVGWNLFGESISGVSVGMAIWFVIRKILAGASTVGNLIFSISTIERFQSAAVMLVRSVGRINEHVKNANQVLDILEMEPYLAINPNGVTLRTNQETPITIEFKNVSFSYPAKEIQVLKNINVTFTQGKNTAIVGLNGAGKTTLIKLLTRVYDPTDGEILVNGINLKDYSLDSWREHLAMLSQEYLIYSEETIRENIMLGNLQIRNEDSVYDAAKLATADTFIEELPNTYDQKIGNDFKGGVELSKGQKQKLAIARTWYRRAPFLILDEPTAAVDAVSEDTIFKNLFVHPEKFGYAPTVVVISHKFSNVRKADNIIVLEHGQVVEQGTHEKLMADNGRYAELFNIQAEGFKE